MSNTNNLFCEVLLPLPLPSTYTYRVPRDWEKQVQVGQRVVVSLGVKKLYCGIIYELHSRPPKVQSVKYILSVLDSEPIVSPKMLSFWKWIADYYISYMGEVMVCALPSSLRLKSESIIVINPDFDGNISELDRVQESVVDFVLHKEQTTINDIAKALNISVIMPLITQLIRNGYLITQEEIKDRLRPKTQQYICLTKEYQNEEKLQELFARLEKDTRKQKQYETLMLFFQCAKEAKNIVSKVDLMANKRFCASSFQTLVKAGVFTITKHKISRLKKNDAINNVSDINLNIEQQEAFDSILRDWNRTPVSLIFGVTGSGKTEIYIKLIEQVISQGKQVLFLLPEIALTTTFITRLEKYFGTKVGVYHSRYSKEERAEIYDTVRSLNDKERYDIIIGSRSAIFLPFINLGLVIVDEENDPSYKQYDPSPRYNARDCAIYLASLWNAKTILGSATPALETFYNATNGRYQLLKLKNRYFNVPLPQIIPVDLKEQRLSGNMKGEFSSILIQAIEQALEEKKQVLLFQNRRGFSRSLRCQACGGVILCHNCDVALTYHKDANQLRCHYCGFTMHVPEACPQCGSMDLKMIGFGTEKIEEWLQIIFPDANIARLDLDSTRQKSAYSRIINAFAAKETDIMVGTQMITKGLDFSNVGVVAVMDADALMFFADFRSTERAFAQMTQVAGRSGRRFSQGKVYIQTLNPQNKVIQDVCAHSYSSMYNSQILERKVFKYPPFYRLIKISCQSIKQEIAEKSADFFAQQLRVIYGGRVLGPQEPLIGRIRNRYIVDILMKVERTASIKSVKSQIRQLSELTHSKYSKARIAIDVDPL